MRKMMKKQTRRKVRQQLRDYTKRTGDEQVEDVILDMASRERFIKQETEKRQERQSES